MDMTLWKFLYILQNLLLSYPAQKRLSESKVLEISTLAVEVDPACLDVKRLDTQVSEFFYYSSDVAGPKPRPEWLRFNQ